VDVITVGPSEAQARRSHRRLVVVAVAVALVLVPFAVVKAVPVARLFLPAEVRAAGEWHFSHEVDISGEWRVRSRSVSATSETTRLETTGGSAACEVSVYTADAFALPPTADRASPVHGHVAHLLPAPRARSVLAWRYGHNAWATASCPERTRYEDAALYAIAGAVRFRESDVRLPFSFDRLPGGYGVDKLTEMASGQTSVRLARAGSANDDRPMHLTFGEQEQASAAYNATGTRLELDGYAAVINDGPPISLCLEVQGHHFCASTDDGEPSIILAERPSASSITALRQLLSAVRFPQHLENRSTWTEASAALPR
jgi:hypothetical protein